MSSFFINSVKGVKSQIKLQKMLRWLCKLLQACINHTKIGQIDTIPVQLYLIDPQLKHCHLVNKLMRE